MKSKDKRAIKADLYRRSRGRCAYCDAPMTFAEATLDHWQPKAVGGGNSRDNLRLTCAPCNNRKGGMTPWEWIMRSTSP